MLNNINVFFGFPTKRTEMPESPQELMTTAPLRTQVELAVY